MSQRAALIAVIVAFLVGITGSLAVRPPSGNTAPAQSTDSTRAAQRISWRVPIAFATNLPVIGDAIVYVADTLSATSNGAVNLQVFEPGEIVPPFSITDAVRDGKVEAGYTWLGYDQGKVAAAPLLGAVPFGMEPWEFSAWWFDAGGRELGEALYAKQNIHILYCGITGPETAGWFREPLESLDDVQGLKIRFAGLGGKVIEQAGASVTMLPGGEIFQALEKGAIDATEYSLPIVDQRLGFNRVAGFNYYPGWHQPSTSFHLAVNLQVWNQLNPADQGLLEAVCTASVTRNLSRSEALQGAVIAGFPNVGVSAEILPDDVLRKLEEISGQVMAQEAARDEDFRLIHESQQAFRNDYAKWKSRAYLPRDF
tara:strand:+ start:6121 stop:7227 length:1107 start_codon:yes stop_codon:yes gene_type:complete